MDDMKLQGLRVLVTRPEPENQAFCQWVREQGGEPISFPLIEIIPSSMPMPELERATPIAGVIFISKPAIDYGLWPVLQAVVSLSTHQNSLSCYTVGKASAQHLKKYYEQGANNPVNHQANNQVATEITVHPIADGMADRPRISIEYPSEGHGGEALLKLPRFNHIENEHWWIVRGGAGLEWLYHQMTARGATVHYWDAYLRKPILYAHQQIQAVLQEKIEIILLFSGEMVQIFEVMLACLSIECQIRVKLTKVWVLSDRVADFARKAGFTDIKILTEPFFKKEAF
jgi:uroporphyrinogen-III synthase